MARRRASRAIKRRRNAPTRGGVFALALALQRGHRPRRASADAWRLARTVPGDVLRSIAHAEEYHRNGRRRRRNPILQIVGAPAKFFAKNPHPKRSKRLRLMKATRWAPSSHRKGWMDMSMWRCRKTVPARGIMKSRKRKKNPLASLAGGFAFGAGAVAGNRLASRVLGRNPGGATKARAGQRVLSAKIIPFSEAARLVGPRDAALASRGFRGFHGRDPMHAIRVRIDDGSSRLTRRAVFEVGNAPSLEYMTRDHSDKARDKGGKRILWRHRMGELGGTKPTIVHDPKSGVTSFVGGTYRIGRAEGGDKKTWYLH